MRIDPASFRDPSGNVFLIDEKVFRTVNAPAIDDFEYVESTELMSQLVEKGWCVESKVVDPKSLNGFAENAKYILRHSKIPFISYPYEWPFAALKAAALLHLDIHLLALRHGVTLSDASAYNVQFIGASPVFIDRLSFVRYHDGDLWVGHRQFCEQFLNPLLLRALLGIPHNAWYRGRLEGIATEELNRLIPITKKLSFRILAHVVLQSSFQKNARKCPDATHTEQIKQARLPLASLVNMLGKLRIWIEGLEPADTGPTVWGDYTKSHSYASAELDEKHQFVAEFAKAVQPKMLWDIGCNTGDFSMTALEAGAGSAIGFDFDQAVLDLGFSRSQKTKAPFLPLFLDAANPSPDQGWAAKERKGLQDRATADGLLALAFVHHMAIAKNIPLKGLLSWLTGFAPQGVIEFVPKSDAMVQELLRLRKDIFEDYTEEAFFGYLQEFATVERSLQVSQSGRKLVWYRR